jgi:integrase
MPILSKRVVDDAATKSREYTIWDDRLPGFGLRVRAKGGRSYVLVYKALGGASRRVTIGKPCDALTPDQARRAAYALRERVRQGEDPAMDKRAHRDQLTVNDVIDRWLSEHAKVHLKQSTIKNALARLDRNIRPRFGALKIGDINRDRIKQWHAAMGKSPTEANRALAYLSSVLSMAVRDWDLLPSNPCFGIRRFKQAKRSRYLNDDELKRLGEALYHYEMMGTPQQRAATLAVRLLLFTGCRPSEILGLRWEWIDWQQGTFSLPDAKTGAREVSMGAPAITLLKADERRRGFVVHVDHIDLALKLDTLQESFQHFCKRAGIENARPYDLRHTAATAAAQANVGAFAIRDMLGHASIAMSNVYVERASSSRQAAADAASHRIAAALSGKSADVVALRKRKAVRA